MSELFSKRLPVILAAGAICVFAAVLISLVNEDGSAQLGGPIVVRPAPSVGAPDAAGQTRSVADIRPVDPAHSEDVHATDRH